ncbi:MAG TPA: tyrosine-type recombinase/integrase, partial [Vicinamibacterales bacterium]|nr:tyrosine-type recombinase/integrase [Vicinamibacterales bacterium]
HKTVRRVRRPLVVPIAAQLLRVLQDAWRRFPDADYVVTYHGRPVKNITGGAKAAAEAAGLTYGRDVRNADGNPIGLTFHTLRHTATTLMSDLVDSPFDLMDAAGHSDIATTMQYRHTRPRHQKPTLERLSRSVKIEDVVTKPNLMARRHTA